MTKLEFQKRLAAAIMKIGKSRVWISPEKEKQKEIKSAITRADVKKFISKGDIKEKPEKIKRPREKKKKRKGPGSRKGSKYARLPRKRRWINTVRPLRRMLKELKDEGKIDNSTYRKLYMLVKGGQFRSRSHMRIYMEQHGMIKKEEK
jgi:large subunit ribosomal protein L19e